MLAWIQVLIQQTGARNDTFVNSSRPQYGTQGVTYKENGQARCRGSGQVAQQGERQQGVSLVARTKTKTNCLWRGQKECRKTNFLQAMQQGQRETLGEPSRTKNKNNQKWKTKWIAKQECNPMTNKNKSRLTIEETKFLTKAAVLQLKVWF